AGRSRNYFLQSYPCRRGRRCMVVKRGQWLPAVSVMRLEQTKRNMGRSKHWVFGTLFGLILVAVSLVGIEFLSSFYLPAWPARAMNPREPARERPLPTPFKNQPWLADPDNSWGMRDSERTIAKAPDTFRAVFVGDSFVDSRFTPLSLPAAVQQRLP